MAVAPIAMMTLRASPIVLPDLLGLCCSLKTFNVDGILRNAQPKNLASSANQGHLRGGVNTREGCYDRRAVGKLRTMGNDHLRGAKVVCAIGINVAGLSTPSQG